MSYRSAMWFIAGWYVGLAVTALIIRTLVEGAVVTEAEDYLRAAVA